nr:hypothetical protein [Tanacetum cinerariifolium]
GAPDAPAGGGGGGGCGGGDPEEFLVSHVSFFSSGELLPDLIGVGLSNQASMTYPTHYTTSCDLHEPYKIYIQTSVVGEFPSYQRIVVVVMTDEVVVVDVGSGEPDCAGPNPGNHEEGQVGPNPSNHEEGQAGPNPGVQDEGQAGSNPGDAAKSQPKSSHVVHAGPNLEHIDLEATDASTQQNPKQMDEKFTTTAYPNVQENLKLPSEDQVIL